MNGITYSTCEERFEANDEDFMTKTSAYQDMLAEHEAVMREEKERGRIIELLTPLTTETIPGPGLEPLTSATNLNTPAGTLTVLAAWARARTCAQPHRFKYSIISSARSIPFPATEIVNRSLPLKNNYSHIAHNYL